eukprot:gene11592-11736_t
MAVVSPEGVENCLAVARSLYQTAETTVKYKLLLDEDVQALNDVKFPPYDIYSADLVGLDTDFGFESSRAKLPGMLTSRVSKGSEAGKLKSSAGSSVLDSSGRDLSRAKALRSINTKDGILSGAAGHSNGNLKHVSAAPDAAPLSDFSFPESNSSYRSPQAVRHLQKSPIQQQQEDLLFADTFGIPVPSDQTSWPAPNTPTNRSVQDSLAVARAHARRVSGQQDCCQTEQNLPQQQQLEAGYSPAARAGGQRPFLHLDPSKIDYSSAAYGAALSASQPSRYRHSQGGVEAAYAGVDQQQQQYPGSLGSASLRNSADVSSSLEEAAFLTSNSSRIHVLQEAVRMRTCEDDALVDVPKVPACLAVTKRSPWWRRLVGLALLAGAGAAVAANIDLLQELSKRTGWGGKPAPTQGQRQQPTQESRAQPQLPFAPVGPAPDASAGCG